MNHGKNEFVAKMCHTRRVLLTKGLQCVHASSRCFPPSLCAVPLLSLRCDDFLPTCCVAASGTPLNERRGMVLGGDVSCVCRVELRVDRPSTTPLRKKDSQLNLRATREDVQNGERNAVGKQCERQGANRGAQPVKQRASCGTRCWEEHGRCPENAPIQPSRSPERG